MFCSFTIPEVLPVSAGVLLDGVSVAVPLADVAPGEVQLIDDALLPSSQGAIDVEIQAAAE